MNIFRWTPMGHIWPPRMSLKSIYIYHSNELFVAFLAFSCSPIQMYTNIIMELKRNNSTLFSPLLVTYWKCICIHVVQMCCERGRNGNHDSQHYEVIFLKNIVVLKVIQFNMKAMMSSCTLASNVLFLFSYVLFLLAKLISLHISWFMMTLLVLSCFFSFFSFS